MITATHPERTVSAKTTTTPARRGTRVSGAERDRAGKRAVALYAEGKSVREVLAVLGWSYGATHRLLREYGAVMRGRGSGNHKRQRP